MIVLVTLLKGYHHWLPELLEQHREFPKVLKWFIVERVDRSPGYGVNRKNLLRESGKPGSRVVSLECVDDPYDDPLDQVKKARNLYLDEVEKLASGSHVKYVYQLNPDEFLTREHQEGMVDCLNRACTRYHCCLFRHRLIYRANPASSNPLFHEEITDRPTGSLLNIRAFRYIKGMRYESSCFYPDTPRGTPYFKRMKKYDSSYNAPEVVNLSHVDKGVLMSPGNNCLVPYRGPVPEVFRK